MLGTTPYINPDYIQPLISTVDSKNSPLALLAQTCSSIGKEKSNKSHKHHSSSHNKVNIDGYADPTKALANTSNKNNNSNNFNSIRNNSNNNNNGLMYYSNIYKNEHNSHETFYYKHSQSQYLNNADNIQSRRPRSPTKNCPSINKGSILSNGNNSHKRGAPRSHGDSINKTFYRTFQNGNDERSDASHPQFEDAPHNKTNNNIFNNNINNNVNNNINNNVNNNVNNNINNNVNNKDTTANSNSNNSDGTYHSPPSSTSSFPSGLPGILSTASPYPPATSFASPLHPYNDHYLTEWQQQLFSKLQQEFLLQSTSSLYDPFSYFTSQQQQQQHYLLQLQMMQYLKQQQYYDSNSVDLSQKSLKVNDPQQQESFPTKKHVSPTPPLSSKNTKNTSNKNTKSDKNRFVSTNGDARKESITSTSSHFSSSFAPATSTTNKHSTIPTSVNTSATPHATTTNTIAIPHKTTLNTTATTPSTTTHLCNWCKPGEQSCGKSFDDYSQLFEHLKEHVSEADVTKSSSFSLPLYNLFYANSLSMHSPFHLHNSLLAQQMLYYFNSTRASTDTFSKELQTSLQSFFPSSSTLPALASPLHLPSSLLPPISAPSTPVHRYHPYKTTHEAVEVAASLARSTTVEGRAETSVTNSNSYPFKNNHFKTPSLPPLTSTTTPSPLYSPALFTASSKASSDHPSPRPASSTSPPNN